MSGMHRTGAARRRRKLAVWLGAVGLCATGSALVPLGSSQALVPPQSEGIKCTDGTIDTGTGIRSYEVHATDGYISMPDGNAVYSWSYTSRGSFQFPGPILCANEGESVDIALVNDLAVSTSIQIPGIDGVLAGGVPAGPEVDSVTPVTGGNLASLVQSVPAGGTLHYSFTNAKPGTYVYESGTDPELQVQMGLFGTIVVRSTVGVTAGDITGKFAGFSGNAAAMALKAGCAYRNPAGTACDESAIYNASLENVIMLSEVDPAIHNFMELNKSDASKLNSGAYTDPYAPHYFLINGRSFPDTIAPNDASWLPNQPYGGQAHVQPWELNANPLDALLRYVGVGVTSYPFHPHSNHERVIAEDGQLLKSINGTRTDDTTEEKFSIMVNPGSTADATFRWTNEEGYSDTGGNRVPVAIPASLNLTEGDFWSGSPYLGQSGQLNPGINGQTQCGEYYHVAHSHDLSQATNYGASFGGMLTLIRVEPPDAIQSQPGHSCTGA